MCPPSNFVAKRLNRRLDGGLRGTLGLPSLSVCGPVRSELRKPPIPSTCLRVRVPDVLSRRTVLGDYGASASEEVGVIIARLGESGRSTGCNVCCSGVPFALEHNYAAANIVKLPPDFAPKVSRRTRGCGAPCLSSANAANNASIINVHGQRRER